jgi:OmpA-OmpF porin, OOP family
MHANGKILTGALVTAALALVLHSYGMGAGFIKSITTTSQNALNAAGMNGVTASFTQTPLQRVATLSGTATDADKDKALSLVRGVPGVHDALWAASSAAKPEAQPAPQAVADCQSGVDTLIKGKTIAFANGQSKLTQAGGDLVTQLAGALAKCQGVKVEVAGHTDLVGNPKSNQALSETRAKSVVDALIAKGVPAGQLMAKGYGASKPVVQAISHEANAKNRRIEFIVNAAS